MPRASSGSYLALIAAGVCWGLGFPFAKLSLHALAPAHMILLRFVVASVAALPIVLRSPVTRVVLRDRCVLLAGLLCGPAFIIQFEGVARATVSTSALLVGAMPVLLAATARVFFAERVSRPARVGIAAATAGAALLAGRPSGGSSGSGILLILLSLLLCVGWILILRRVPKDLDPVAASCAAVLVATFVDFPIVLMLQGAPPLRLSAGAWAGIAGQGLLSTIAATVAWQVGASRVSATSSGVFLNLEPLVGALCGVALFGDALTVNLMLGGVAIVLGSMLVATNQTGRRPLGERSRAPT